METVATEAQFPDIETIDAEGEGLDLRGWSKSVPSAVLGGILIFLLFGFIRYFRVEQYVG